MMWIWSLSAQWIGQVMWDLLLIPGLVNCHILPWKDPPFFMEKLWKTMENHHFFMGNLQKTMERSTIFNGKIHYFDWAIFNSYVQLPEGMSCGRFQVPWSHRGDMRWWMMMIICWLVVSNINFIAHIYIYIYIYILIYGIIILPIDYNIFQDG